MSLVALCALLLPAPQEPELPLVVVEGPTAITSSCLVRIPSGVVIPDPEGDGALSIRGEGLTVMFEDGSVLRGAGEDVRRDGLAGIGIAVEEAPGLRLIGAAVEGYRVGIRIARSDGARVDGAMLRRNHAQELHSTPAAEAGEDWLFPHANDDLEWERHHGAGLSIHRSRGVEVRGVVVREQQNGILLDRVVDSRIHSNDASFLSGWGLAMWRSSDNVVSRNSFDFCIRGYSHGVYNRGQDSAGILMFEQCSRNIIVENSATHGGDGLFAFAGKEALGEHEAPAGFDHARAGNNDNLFVGNDFSFAAAHGLELTFSFGNLIAENRLEGNAICGVWGGFSQDLTVVGNRFLANGDRGYGLERGGVNVDHAHGLWVLDNGFEGDQCGVHAWRMPGAFADLAWGQANDLGPGPVVLDGNRFDVDGPAIHLRGEMTADLGANEIGSTEEGMLIEGPAASRAVTEDRLTAAGARRLRAAEGVARARAAAVGDRRPLGLRERLRGRENIRMTAWGPWDHEAPVLLPLGQDAEGFRGYALLPTTAPLEEIAVVGAVEMRPGRGADGSQEFWLKPEELGVVDYALELRVGGAPIVAPGRFITADWRVHVFPTTADPREDPGAWMKAAGSEAAREFRMGELALDYGMGGPAELLGAEGIPRDGFGTLARGGLRLPPGRWRLHLRSDDGVRLYLDGELLHDDWTHHAPRTATIDLRVERARSLPLRIEHFELDGYAVLSLEVEELD